MTPEVLETAIGNLSQETVRKEKDLRRVARGVGFLWVLAGLTVVFGLVAMMRSRLKELPPVLSTFTGLVISAAAVPQHKTLDDKRAQYEIIVTWKNAYMACQVWRNLPSEEFTARFNETMALIEKTLPRHKQQ